MPCFQRRIRRAARDCSTIQPAGSEVTAGGASGASEARIEALQRLIRERLGEPAEQLSHSCDVFVSEVLRYWPDREMCRIAIDPDVNAAAGAALRAIPVITAKCRENLESRWGMGRPTAVALDLLLEPVVVQVANIWFRGTEERILIMECVGRLRGDLSNGIDGGGDEAGAGGIGS